LLGETFLGYLIFIIPPLSLGLHLKEGDVGLDLDVPIDSTVEGEGRLVEGEWGGAGSILLLVPALDSVLGALGGGAFVLDDLGLLVQVLPILDSWLALRADGLAGQTLVLHELLYHRVLFLPRHLLLLSILVTVEVASGCPPSEGRLGTTPVCVGAIVLVVRLVVEQLRLDVRVPLLHLPNVLSPSMFNQPFLFPCQNPQLLLIFLVLDGQADQRVELSGLAEQVHPVLGLLLQDEVRIQVAPDCFLRRDLGRLLRRQLQRIALIVPNIHILLVGLVTLDVRVGMERWLVVLIIMISSGLGDIL